MHEIGPFSIPAIRFIPEKAKPWLIVFLVIMVQLSGGIYLAAVSEMVGTTSLLHEDIMMAGYASLIGMSLTFVIIFRIKFRFTSKYIMFVSFLMVIICNIVCMHTKSVPVLVGTCFVAGFFRMVATFECNSTIQLWITPKRDLSVFFCYVYLLVQSAIQLSGLITIYTAFFASWEYMHIFIIGLLALSMLLILIFFRTCRTLPRIPFYGIDWLGGILWGIMWASIAFVCTYGEYYDWFQSAYIRIGSASFAISALLNVWRASFIRHPFISLRTIKYKIVYVTFFIYIIVDILIAPSHSLEMIYTEAVLRYDSLNIISLNWIVLLGNFLGVVFTFFLFAKRKCQYRTMAIIGFAAITAYLLVFYFIIDYNLPKEYLMLPIMLRSFGYVIIAIIFLTSLTKVPFEHFFQAVSIQNVAGACIASVIGSSIVEHAYKILLKSNFTNLIDTIDSVNGIATSISPNELYGALQVQALMVTLKELFGWLAILGIFCTLAFMISRSDLRPKYALLPTYRTLKRIIRKENKETELEDI